MKHRCILFSLLMSLSLFNCSNTDQKTSTEKTPTKSKKEVVLNGLPEERLIRLWEQATQLDYIFLELPISMNMDNQEAIRSSLVNIDPKGTALHPSCKQHDGNMVFSINGEIVEECMFYYRNDCKYFVWLENGKPTYANPMTENGIKFFDQAFSGSVLKQAQDQQSK